MLAVHIIARSSLWIEYGVPAFHNVFIYWALWEHSGNRKSTCSSANMNSSPNCFSKDSIWKLRRFIYSFKVVEYKVDLYVDWQYMNTYRPFIHKLIRMSSSFIRRCCTASAPSPRGSTRLFSLTASSKCIVDTMFCYKLCIPNCFSRYWRFASCIYRPLYFRLLLVTLRVTREECDNMRLADIHIIVIVGYNKNSYDMHLLSTRLQERKTIFLWNFINKHHIWIILINYRILKLFHTFDLHTLVTTK